MMPRDAKLGLVAGVGLVIAIAVMFYRKDPAVAYTQGGDEAAIAPAAPMAAPVPPAPAATVAAPVAPALPSSPAAPAATATRPEWSTTSVRTRSYSSPLRRHRVVAGDTLTGLARKYYGAEQQSFRIIQANRKLVNAAAELTPGTELVIPEEASGNQ